MSEPNSDGVRVVGKLESHVCQLSKVLGEPQVLRIDGYYRTAWTFRYPNDEYVWILSHLSTEPICRDGNCLQHEPVVWNIYGETDELALLYDMAAYVFDSLHFFCDEGE